jgi:hypothetical protein
MEVLIVASEAVGETLRDIHLAPTGHRIRHVRGWSELAMNPGDWVYDLVIIEVNDGSALNLPDILHRFGWVSPKTAFVVFGDDPELVQCVRPHYFEAAGIHVAVRLPDTNFVPYIGYACVEILHGRAKRPTGN